MKELLLKLVASDRKHLDGALLFLRLFIGGMMLSHGWAKLASFSTLSATFPDPLGVGSTLSLLLILFAEVGCSCLLIFGLMTRLAALPLMFGMLMAFFVIHGAGLYIQKLSGNQPVVDVENSALYNNTAATAGDDLLLSGATYTLPVASQMPGDKKLASDGEDITGWYHDNF